MKSGGEIMRLTILLVAVLALTLTFSKAEADYSIWGAGIDSCEKWIDAHAETGQSNGHTEWVLGYITAEMRSSGGDFTGDADFPSMSVLLPYICAT
jgi:hypothetical protein